MDGWVGGVWGGHTLLSSNFMLQVGGLGGGWVGRRHGLLPAGMLAPDSLLKAKQGVMCQVMCTIRRNKG